MSLRLIPAGSVIERVYYAVPGHYTIGTAFGSWDSAVREARRRYEAAVDAFVGNGAAPTREDCENIAKTAFPVVLRWVIRHPDGSSDDREMERYPDVTFLHTDDETGAKA